MKKYFKTHEWLEKTEEENIYKLGISEHAVTKLGDVVFIEKVENESFEAGETVLILESVKAVADVYTPDAASVHSYNEDLIENPEKLNHNDYLISLKIENPSIYESAMDLASYEAQIED